MAVFRVEKTGDFTVMANGHLRDKGLSLRAKGLLSLMLSLPEDWDYTLRGLASLGKDGVDAMAATVRELENAGYVRRERTRDAKGRMGRTVYTIWEKPGRGQIRRRKDADGAGGSLGQEHPAKGARGAQAQTEPQTEKPGLAAPAPEAPKGAGHPQQRTKGQSTKGNIGPSGKEGWMREDNMGGFAQDSGEGNGRSTLAGKAGENGGGSHLRGRKEEISIGENAGGSHLRGRETASKTRKDSNEGHLRGREKVALLGSDGKRLRGGEEKTQTGEKGYGVERNYAEALSAVRRNIEAEYLARRFEAARVEEAACLVAEVLCSAKKRVRIGGEELAAEVVKERLWALRAPHVEYVFERMDDCGPKVKNIHAYLLTCLYNAPATIESYWQAEVRRDMRVGAR